MATIDISFEQSPEVIEGFRAKRPLPVALSSAQWDAVDAKIKADAFFSARVSNEKLLREMRDYIARAEAGAPGTSRADFIATMRQKMGAPEGDSGKLTDISSGRRLGLIYDFHRQRNSAAARYESTSGADYRAWFPARELYRADAAKVPRDWRAIWTEAGGQLYGGRMIAAWDDPIWTAISRFGSPYPPFDYGSHMDTRDVSATTAEKLGWKPAQTSAVSEKEPADAATEEPAQERAETPQGRAETPMESTVADIPAVASPADKTTVAPRADYGDATETILGASALARLWRKLRAQKGAAKKWTYQSK